MTPFRVLLGVHPRIRDDPDVRRILEDELVASFDDDRDELRQQVKRNIEKIQRDNKAGYDKKRKKPTRYDEGDIVAIKRSQQGSGLKFSHKYLGLYEVIKVLRNHRYVLHKVEEYKEPLQASSTADFMKPWLRNDHDDEEFSEKDEGMEDVEHSG